MPGGLTWASRIFQLAVLQVKFICTFLQKDPSSGYWLGGAVYDIMHDLGNRHKPRKTATLRIKLSINLFNLHVHRLTSSWWSQKKKTTFETDKTFSFQ